MMKSALATSYAPSQVPMLIHRQTHCYSQQGAVLLTGLIMLLVLTLIGVSGLSSITMEEKMVSNMQNKNRAFQGAEAALSFCENYLESNNQSVLQVGADKVVDINTYTVNHGSDDWWKDSGFWSANGTEFTASDQGLALNPRCVVELVGKAGGGLQDKDKVIVGGVAYVYKATSASPGYDTKASAAVESIYAIY